MALIVEASHIRDAKNAWLAANYNTFAFHKPDDMPEPPDQFREPEVSSQAEVVEAKAWMQFVSRKQHGD